MDKKMIINLSLYFKLYLIRQKRSTKETDIENKKAKGHFPWLSGARIKKAKGHFPWLSEHKN
jgi:hypothetical protein